MKAWDGHSALLWHAAADSLRRQKAEQAAKDPRPGSSRRPTPLISLSTDRVLPPTIKRSCFCCGAPNGGRPASSRPWGPEGPWHREGPWQPAGVDAELLNLFAQVALAREQGALWQEWAELLELVVDAHGADAARLRYIKSRRVDFEAVLAAGGVAAAKRILEDARHRLTRRVAPQPWHHDHPEDSDHEEFVALMDRDELPRSKRQDRRDAEIFPRLRAEAKRNGRTGEAPGRKPQGTRDAAEAECLLLGYCPGATITELRACVRRGRTSSSVRAKRRALENAVYRLLSCDRSVTGPALAEALCCALSTVYTLRNAGAEHPPLAAAA